ncbi:MAG: hypothetical protein Q7T80_14660 [Methanoregula sp.]|nr:hypothetical protein [Methanoregula sp.]
MSLAVLVLLLFHLPDFTLQETDVPEIFKITNIRHLDEYGFQNYDSHMAITHMGTISYQNRNLMAKIFKNKIPLNFVFATLNGDDYIQHAHTTGVQKMGGEGCSGNLWTPGEMTYIDFNHGTFRPGDRVTFEVYDNTTKQIISRHTYRA